MKAKATWQTLESKPANYNWCLLKKKKEEEEEEKKKKRKQRGHLCSMLLHTATGNRL